MMNAQRFEETFYTPKQVVGREEGERKEGGSRTDVQGSDQEILLKLLEKPEMAALLRTLAGSL